MILIDSENYPPKQNSAPNAGQSMKFLSLEMSYLQIFLEKLFRKFG
nr:MAG TPA: hypothetical protein [Caudoviricetes sp.]